MKQLLSTREVAKVLGVNEKMVYSLITEKGLPATKVTGKWLFPAHLVEQWLENNTVNHPERAGGAVQPGGGVLVLAGSNDLLLDKAMGLFADLNPGHIAAFANLGSLGGIRAMREGLCHMAASHLMEGDPGADHAAEPALASADTRSETRGDNRSGRGGGKAVRDYNFSHARRELEEAPAVVNFCIREQGYLVAPGNPSAVRDAGDIVRKGLRVVNRPLGTGTRLLFDTELARVGADPARIPGYGIEVRRHLDAGIEVLAGRAAAAPGIRAVAGLLGLGFVPVQRERFDLLVPRARYFDRGVQLFLGMLVDARFRALADGFEGYDLAKAGRVVFPGDAP
ncbi:helix-turn-helix transcriptional regulator [Nitratidesulfovibrio sp. HK-II]|uniref:helix-turn-helix transcriptional regulator n=1 Tax=Nitratidesulfovibrio sp. HK-II TaxID=2009266 RepID=UPI000E2E629F|nr:helix-turn-helix transcriptional regulator [Nitratidesulfovibrio sp. HK-II]GBO97213.1 molybdopterin biosynthesis protein MoeA [Nitratidesulfovibrio sp. HK-II]